MKIKLIPNKFKYVIASLLTITSVLLIAASPVYAAGKIRLTKEPPISSSLSNDQLSAMFHHDQVWYSTLRGDLKQGNNMPSQSELLSNETGTILKRTERDLFKYKVNLGRSQALDNEIQMLINTHPGFAANGDVVNSTLAALTVSRLDLFLNNSRYWEIHAKTDFSDAQAVPQIHPRLLVEK